MKNTKFSILKELLLDKKNIVILPHTNPDGDAIGSCLGLMHMLNNFGHNSKVISPNSIPSFLNWVPGFNEILFFDQNKYICREAIANAELIFTLDFSGFNSISWLGSAPYKTSSECLNKSLIKDAFHEFHIPGPTARISETVNINNNFSLSGD